MLDERAANVCDTPPALEGGDDCAEAAGGTSYKWGRVGNSNWFSSIGSLCMMLFCPMIVWLFLWSCAENDCSLERSARVLWRDVTTKPFASYAHRWDVSRSVTPEAAALWVTWFIAQVLLYQLMPGPKDHGQPTPAGYTLKYVVNGWNCWWACQIAVLAILFVTGFEAATIVTRNWMGLFWIANIAGFALALLVYLKAHVAPTHVRDNKWSGSIWYDIFMGVENSPRLSSHPYSLDFKLFLNGRPGIAAWTLVNLCFTVAQYVRFGLVTNSMLILNLLQGIYVADFFWNEGWYLRTIDICHEHFGFYLTWGDLVWLPFMYSLQGLFLSTHPVQLSDSGCAAVLALGIGGYLLFRAVNAQKDRFRKEMKRLEALAEKEAKGAADGSSGSSEAGACSAISADGDQQLRARGSQSTKPATHGVIRFPVPGRTVRYRGHTVQEMDYQTWGGPTRFLSACYRTGTDNEAQQSYLLLSGFWGISRHFNYLGDLMLSLSWCLCCGFTHLLPYFYIIYMTILLVHRVARDDLRCKQKYGRVWDKYCSIVRWRICPGIY